VVVDDGVTEIELPVAPVDQVIVPPEQPDADSVELPPVVVIVDGLALNVGAAGVVHPLTVPTTHSLSCLQLPPPVPNILIVLVPATNETVNDCVVCTIFHEPELARLTVVGLPPFTETATIGPGEVE
jgi:hypothetical protein